MEYCTTLRCPNKMSRNYMKYICCKACINYNDCEDNCYNDKKICKCHSLYKVYPDSTGRPTQGVIRRNDT